MRALTNNQATVLSCLGWAGPSTCNEVVRHTRIYYSAVNAALHSLERRGEATSAQTDRERLWWAR